MQDDEKLSQTALAKHVGPFIQPVDRKYTPSSVAEGLDKIHSSYVLVKSGVIAGGNALHADGVVCPLGHGDFNPDPQNGYARCLHLGTTRIWNQDGTVNEERWKKFEDFIKKGQPKDNIVVSVSRLNAYLDLCCKEDKPENNTGRNTNSFFSSETFQHLMARGGWKEVFDRLTTGWQVNAKGDDWEPYIRLNLVRLFFDDSNAAFEYARRGETPVPKPTESPVRRASPC